MIRKIDLFRAFLCQYVIFAHLIPAVFPGVLGVPGTLAVWCFFVISGYLNFFSFRDSLTLREYYFKRFIRLYPLLFVSFAVVCLFEQTLFVNDAYTLLPALLDIKNKMPQNGVLWTIIVELQLYLLTPLLFSACQKIRIPAQIMPLCVILLAGLSVVLSYVFSKLIYGQVDFDDRMVFSAIPFYFFGLVLAQGHFRPLVTKFSSWSPWLLLTVALFVLVILDRNNITDIHIAGRSWESLFMEGRLIPFTASLLVILYPATLTWNTKLLETIGKATYEIYLLHGLFIYVLYSYQPKDHSLIQILGFFWILPTLCGIAVHFLVSRKLNNLAKKRVLKDDLYVRTSS